MYPYPSILINQREVEISAILNGTVKATDNHEQTTFRFIADWLSGQEQFTVFTSGSTGNPRPYTFSRTQMAQSAARTVTALGIRKGDTTLVCLNTAFIAGKMMLVRALEHALPLWIVRPSSNPFDTLLPEQMPDFMAVAPLQLNELLDQTENIHRLNRMKAILVGGAPVHQVLRERIKLLRCPVYETYGMTETLSNVALRLLNTPAATETFRPLPGVSIKTDHRGCLVISDAIQKESLITNDLVEIKDDGTFIWLGRADYVINTGGIKVYPEKIEQNLEKVLHEINPSIQWFIGPEADDKLGQVVTIFMHKKDLSESDLERIIAKVKARTSGPEKPRNLILTDAWFLTESGKTDRKRIIKSISEAPVQFFKLT